MAPSNRGRMVREEAASAAAPAHEASAAKPSAAE